MVASAYKVYFEELNRLGYIEGQNLIVERYSALGQPDRIGDLARQIVASHPDVILPFSGVFIQGGHGDDHRHSHGRSNC